MVFFRCTSALLLAACLTPALAGDFDLPEPVIHPSPDSARKLAISEGERVRDLDVSPWSGKAAILVQSKGGRGKVRVWDLHSDSASTVWDVPDSIQANSFAWHPAKD